MNPESHILLFDGVCNLCNGTVQFIIKNDPDGQFKFASLQSERGQALLIKLGLPTNHFDSFVYIAGDTYYIKSTAVLHILKKLGGFWKLLYVLMLFPRPVRDFFYGLVAKTRYSLFGKRESCMIPTDNIKQRFLL